MLGLTEPRDKDVSESSRNGGNFVSFHDSQQNPLQPGEYSVGQKMARPVARSQSRSDLDIVWEDDNTSFSSQTQADFSYLSTTLGASCTATWSKTQSQRNGFELLHEQQCCKSLTFCSDSNLKPIIDRNFQKCELRAPSWVVILA